MSLLRRIAVDPDAETIYQIDVGFACGGVVVRNDTVVNSAPIFNWMRGRSWPTIARWDKIISINTCEKL